jgi:hypothetical protein
MSDSLAARLASRKSAKAPWLCVTVFRRLCSEQRAYYSTIVEACPHDCARFPCYIIGRSIAVLRHG